MVAEGEVVMLESRAARRLADARDTRARMRLEVFILNKLSLSRF